MTASGEAWTVPPPRHGRTAAISVAAQYVQLALTLVQGLVLVPLYLRHIPADVYGAWLATGSILGWLELVDPGVSTILQQRVAYTLGQRDRRGLGATIGTGLSISGALALLPLLFLPLAPGAAGWVGYTGASAADLGGAFRLAIIGTSLALLSYGVTAVNVGLQQAAAAGGTAILGGVVGIATTVAALTWGMGLLALPLGLLARTLVGLTGNALWLARWSRLHLRGAVALSLASARSLVGPIGVTAVSRIGVALVTRLDAFVVARFLGPTEVVTLTLTTRALEIVRLACDRVGAALTPSIAHLAGERRLDRVAALVHKAADVTGWLWSLGAFGVVALNGAFVTLWVGRSHFGGQALTLLAAFAASAATSTALQGNFVLALGGVASIARLSFVEALVRVPALLLLTSALGLLGVPVAALLATLLTSAAWLPGVLARQLEVPGGQERRKWLGAMARPVVAALLGLGAAQAFSMLGVPSTWPGFGIAVVATAVAFVAVTFALFQSVRQNVAELVDRARRGRTRPAPLPRGD